VVTAMNIGTFSVESNLESFICEDINEDKHFFYRNESFSKIVNRINEDLQEIKEGLKEISSLN
jgi:hypothetical protein